MADWSEIVREHGPLVWRTAYRLLDCAADASDCYQKTFLEAVQLARRETVHDWPALLRRLATMRSLDLLRARYRHRNQHESVADITELKGTSPGPVELAESVELANQLRAALAELPKRQAEVFCLCCVDGLDYAEAGRQLGLDPNAAGSLLHRARKRLRQSLASLKPGATVEVRGES